MSIITNAKQYIARKAASAARKAGDGIASLSVLSPKQIQELEKRRTGYLAQKPDMTGPETEQFLRNKLGAIGIEVFQAYLSQIGEKYLPVDLPLENDDADNRIRYFDITKWVMDKNEKNLDKLVNVYHVLSEEECNIALIYNRTVSGCRITVGVANTDDKLSDPTVADMYYMRLADAIRGNFPGAEICGMDSADGDFGIGIPHCLVHATDDLENGRVKSVAIVSNVPSEKSEDFVSQSMEKLLDGIVPKDSSEAYTVVLMARPVKDQLKNKNHLFELYSELSPFASWQTGYAYSESDSEGSSASLSVNLGMSMGAHTFVSASAGAGGMSAGGGKGQNIAGNFGVSFSRASNVSVQIGKNESLNQTYTNLGVKHSLEILESQLKRIEESSALGMWEFASYVISDSPVIANNVSHMYLALTQGEDSYRTGSAVSLWDGDVKVEEARIILESIQKLRHPVFGLKASVEDEWLVYPTLITATTQLSGKELARSLNFPRKSVAGLPVMEVVSFGREPQLLAPGSMDLRIGCGYHMRKAIPSQEIRISREELTKHVFITGSTGSGKSNTIYTMLKNLMNEQVGFLVIEPAKGEYKDVFAFVKHVRVFGTNPNAEGQSILQINPFRFPRHTHILEHLDRLIEIFNLCWPMYAAMPAILKDAAQRSYVRCGWDIEKSVNRYSDELFPTFTDVVREVRAVLNESDYSDDNKGDYIGSLVTRLGSLTNGINGLVFTSDDLADAEIFDGHTIVDLSRVGSGETKSLMIGLLILKLQEYRMEQRSEGLALNASLRHVTVLEEAHNLLRNCTASPSGDGSNMQSKSVEMLSNSIAEMRTYGEGFIIADQSPGLLDMSAIRNTNTKIIMRLPDYNDRQLVGKAGGLNEDQITELARLEKGVAAVSQSDWLEPVLCHVDLFDAEGIKAAVKKSERKKTDISTEQVRQSLLECIMSKEIYRKGDRVDIGKLKYSVLKSKLDTAVKCDFLEYISTDAEKALGALRSLVYDFLKADEAVKASENCREIDDWVHHVIEHLSPGITQYTKQQIDLVIALIVYELSVRNEKYQDILCRFGEIYMKNGGVY